MWSCPTVADRALQVRIVKGHARDIPSTVSIREITAEAGVGLAAVNHPFDGKEGLCDVYQFEPALERIVPFAKAGFQSAAPLPPLARNLRSARGA